MTLRFSPQTRRVFHLSLPIFAELLLQLLVGNMDQFMISPFGTAAVSAIGNGNQVMNVVIIVLETMSAATTILLTRHIGAGKEGEACDEIATVGVAVSGFFSLLMGLILLLAPHVIFTLLRTPAEAFDGACLYTRIVGGAVVIQGLYIELCAVLRSYTLLREVVCVSVVMNLMNVAGNAILINGWLGLPRMGVTGAAVSTCISKAVGLALVLWTLHRKCSVRFSLRYLHPFPLHTCRQTYTYDLFQFFRYNAQFGKMKLHSSPFLHQAADDQARRHTFRNNGCPANAIYAHSQLYYKKQVQNYIYSSGCK